MKIYNIGLLLVFLLFLSCEDDKVEKPVAQFTITIDDVTVDEVSVDETILFTYTGTEAKQVAVFTGDAGHDYDLRDEANSGFAFNRGMFTYAYKEPGTYKVVLIATNYNKEGNEMLYDTVEKTIVVKDERSGLKTVSLKKDLYNKEVPGVQMDNNIIFFAVPYKVRVNTTADIAVNIASQRLELDTYSEFATIQVNDKPFVSTQRYDLSNPVKISVISGSGTNYDFMTKVLRYPVFENFSIEGVNGTITYSDYDFDKVYITVTLPVGTNVSSLSPVFSSLDAKSIEIDGVSQTSGSSRVDFSNPVTYTLATWEGENKEYYCETKIEVTVILN